MKKYIFAALLLISSVYASEVKKSVLIIKEDHKTTKSLMQNIKRTLPITHKIVMDYFQAKTCSDNILEIVAIKEIRKFTTTKQFGTLIGLKKLKIKKATSHYNSLIENFRFMNCGDNGKYSMYNYYTRTSLNQKN